MKIKTERIIAQMVAGVFIAGAIAGFRTSICSNMYLSQEHNAVDEQLATTYTDIKASKDFQQEYFNLYRIYSQAYEQNETTPDEYLKQIEYLQSNKFVEDFINVNPNHADADTFVDLQTQKTELNEKDAKRDYPALIGVGSSAMAVFLASHSSKLKNEIDEEELLQEYSN